MDKTSVLLQLGKEIQQAAVKQDWAALSLLDRQLAHQLTALAAQGAISAHEQQALSAVRKIHAQAVVLVSNEKQRLGYELGQAHSNQEGWVAYALESDMYQDRNQA
ncbi:hypothetical protein [Janthinobacterium aquaticum]|uniref:hypothetical protein n=1 Tax=Janthinobacterium sp. FT58W TaxID=2654254 RepID=UPI0012645E94|nr:hypothetical protein [Janthinobacterium sp. FT58W]KAB8044451.1 hypothetical protein GCM43_04420 [Janthinobacterium sp. FT58W]